MNKFIKSKLFKKSAGGGVAVSATIVAVWAFSAFGIAVPPEVVAAMGTLVGYITKIIEQKFDS